MSSKILLIYYEPQPSGQTAHLLSLVRGLDLGRYEVTVVLPVHLTGPVPAFQQAGARVVPLPLRKIRWPPRAVATFVRLIREGSPDIVHVHSQEAGLVARPLARLAGARAILYTPQTIDVRRARWHALYRTLERALAYSTDIIISVNEADRQRLIRWGIPGQKVVTIPNGIDLAEFKDPPDTEQLRQALGMDRACPLVLQVGRLSAQKDPLAFVQGAARVLRTHPNTQFALLGDGPLRDAVTSRIKHLGLEEHVHLLGWRAGASRLMAAADVVTLTSRWEGAPYALLEAMAWSRPVVATAVNGCPEIVIDGVTGFVVPPADTASWAKGVVDLLNDPAGATRMGQQGRLRVEEEFDLQQMTARIEEHYVL